MGVVKCQSNVVKCEICSTYVGGRLNREAVTAIAELRHAYMRGHITWRTFEEFTDTRNWIEPLNYLVRLALRQPAGD